MRLSVVIIASLVVLLLHGVAIAASTDPPRVFLLDAQVIEANRLRVQQGDAELKPALKQLTRQADKLLDAGPFSVMDKQSTPPSGDKHDYQSIGPYWWPNPDKADGLPYLRKDGQVNPERSKTGDAQSFKSMREAVVTLAYAWHFTGQENYAQHAASLLRTWYLDPATRMNPNMQYAQAIPGRTEGRGIGIVDAHSQPKLIDAIGLLQSSKAWTDTDQQGMVEWFDAFLNWLLTSKHGKDEARTKNNHATQYDVQVASYALFVGKPDIAKEVLSNVAKKRIATQIGPDGSQPHELARTRSWDYSVFNTLHFAHLAVLGEHVGVDLWQQPEGQPSILSAIDYLLPYATGQKKWQSIQIRSFNAKDLLVSLLVAAKHDKAGRYREAAQQLLADDAIERLVYPTP